jgi:copper/silver efflux system protein
MRGQPTGGWDPHELRSIQDFIVKYALAGVEGVPEVASIGGFVRSTRSMSTPTRCARRA